MKDANYLSLPIIVVSVRFSTNHCQVYTAFDTHLDALGVYKLDTVGDAFVVVAGLDGFKSQEASEKRGWDCTLDACRSESDPGLKIIERRVDGRLASSHRLMPTGFLGRRMPRRRPHRMTRTDRCHKTFSNFTISCVKRCGGPSYCC